MSVKPHDINIEVQSRKYDGQIHRRWYARLISQDSSLIVVQGVFQEAVNHRLLGLVEQGTVSTEYFWMNQWYSIFQFTTPTGQLRNYYCNINQPPNFDGKILSFIDLDVDILVAPDLSYQVLDEDEFIVNAERFNYPPEIHDQVQTAIKQILSRINLRQKPFN
jgi:uncharacterized protein